MTQPLGTATPRRKGDGGIAHLGVGDGNTATASGDGSTAITLDGNGNTVTASGEGRAVGRQFFR